VIAAALVLLVLTPVPAVVFGYITWNRWPAAEVEKEARSYLHTLGVKDVTGVSCTTYDSDGDGYLTCDANIPAKTGCPAYMSIKCKMRAWDKGCKRNIVVATK